MSGASSVLPIKLTLMVHIWFFMVLSNCEFFEFKIFWDDLDDLEVFEFVVVRQGETCSGVPPP